MNEDVLKKTLQKILDEIAEIRSEMATKDDLAELRSEMATKDDLAEVRSEMATKDDLAEVRSEMATGFARLEDKFDDYKIENEMEHRNTRRVIHQLAIRVSNTLDHEKRIQSLENVVYNNSSAK